MSTPPPTKACCTNKRSKDQLLYFIAENNLPFTLAPTVTNLVKEFAKDQKALSQLSIDSTSASYKMRL